MKKMFLSLMMLTVLAAGSVQLALADYPSCSVACADGFDTCIESGKFSLSYCATRLEACLVTCE